jgi:hypothetical protein
MALYYLKGLHVTSGLCIAKMHPIPIIPRKEKRKKRQNTSIQKEVVIRLR